MIRIVNLTHVYTPPGREPVVALRNVDLTISAGEYVALIGANGSGKTTLARHLNALLLPTVGDVWVNGHNTRDPSAHRAIRADVGMVFQSPEDQFVATVVLEDVAFGPENLGVPTSEIRRRARVALERVGMWEARHRPPHMLSAGQQQRVAIAGALAMEPRCLVLDEATAMLDPRGRRRLLDLLDELHRDGMTIIAITHYMSEAARAQRVILLHRGRVALDGEPREVLGHLSDFGLAPPPITSLARRLHRRFPDIPPDVLTPDELATAIVEVKQRVASRDPPGGLGEVSFPTWATRRADSCAPFLSPVPDGVKGHREAGASVDLAQSASAEAKWQGRRAMVQVRELYHTYMVDTPLAQPSLHGIALTVARGQTIALLGATGSGKSTLLQHLNGLWRPQRGQVWVADYDLSDPRTDLRQVRRLAGLVFQRPEDQLFERYVGDDVAYGPRMVGLRGKELRERVRQAMEWVGLDFERDKDRLIATLSGGERRKVGLAGLLALRPRLLLLDEPTAGLDPTARAGLIDRLRALRAQGLTMVIATHNMDDVTALADYVYVLMEGRVALHGPTRRVLAQADRLRALGLEEPSVIALMIDLRERGLDVPPDTLTVDEAEMVIAGLFAAGKGRDERV